MKLVAISDTHMAHDKLFVPSCDLLIHAGDFTKRGRAEELDVFLRWFAQQPARHKILVAGNHDFICEKDRALVRAATQTFDVIYLEDERVDIGGVRLWGSPITPSFGSWAFQRQRGASIAAVWAHIPDELDVLITHGPPMGLGDRIFLGRHVGCADLRARVEAVRPSVHIFGHIHEAHGDHTPAGSPTRFYNVAVKSLVPLFPDADVTQIDL